MGPKELLERSMRISVRGHQLVRLRWEPAAKSGDPDTRQEFSPRPATDDEIKMWDRLLMLERMMANLQVMLADVVAERDALKRWKEAKELGTHADRAEPRRSQAF